MNLTAEDYQSIRKLVGGEFFRMRQIRRELHQHPELSGDEIWTTQYLTKQLESLGLPIRTKVGGHGIVADLVVDPMKPTVALRVDMDALPIHEVNDVPYRSKLPGVMHACGHDVHSAIGVGTAAVLCHLKDVLPGNVRFIFQPEEEEISGAQKMIKAGVLREPTPSAIFGFHVAPIPVGQIAWSDSLFLAGFDHYLLRLYPQAGWDIRPNHLNAIARRCCQVIQNFNDWQLPLTWEAMQSFWIKMVEGPPSLRNFIIYDASLDEEKPGVWVGQLGVGVKAANFHLRRLAVGRIRASLNTICRLTHTRYSLDPMGSMIDMQNHPQLVRSTLPALHKMIGTEHIIQLKAAFPFNCEDFAYYAELIPGAMYWIGAANPAVGKFAMLHTPDFDVDERCLVAGTQAMVALLWNALLINF